MNRETKRDADPSQQAARSGTYAGSAHARGARETDERAREGGDGGGDGAEQFGPLRLERRRKDDGRALLLFALDAGRR